MRTLYPYDTRMWRIWVCYASAIAGAAAGAIAGALIAAAGAGAIGAAAGALERYQ